MILKEYWPYEPCALIWGISGNLGGGKTLSAVGAILEAFQRGFFVVTNIQLNEKALTDFLGTDRWKDLYQLVGDLENENPFNWPQGSPRGSGGHKRVVVILDECAEWFDQYASVGKSGNLKNVWSWLRHSSKRGQDVIFIIQRVEFLNKVLRSLVARWCWVEDLRTFRIQPFGFGVPWFLHPFVYRWFLDRTCKVRCAPGSFAGKAFLGKFYFTAQSLSVHSGDDGKEYKAVRIDRGFPFAPVWRFSCVLAVFYCFQTVWQIIYHLVAG